MSVNFDYFDRSEIVQPVAVDKRFQRDHPYQDGFKRALDVGIVIALLPLLVPLILALACVVLVSGQRPFFVQPRLGRHGRVFAMLKLRTMAMDAPERLAAHLRENPEAAREWRLKQKLSNDPRVTRVGAFLRRTSLDELPQVWNVLRGDMALVGPRPMLVEQAPFYPGQAYFRMRPGITGPWQVSERNASEFAARCRFDTLYDLRQGPGFDLAILWRTVGVVWRQTGC